MNFELCSLGVPQAAAAKCDALVVLVPDGFAAGGDALSTLIGDALHAGDLETGAGKLLPAYRPAGIAAARVLLAGAGDGTARATRKAVSTALAALKGAPVRKLMVCFAGAAESGSVAAAVLAVADATYVYTHTRTKAEGRKIQRVQIAANGAPSLQGAFDQAVATVSGVELAREWANRPANHATPTALAAAARELTRLPGIRCEVLGPKQVASLGMGAFAAVAQGSAEPLRFIVLRYSGAGKAVPPTVLVGKGITFDTGGISIKPAPEMDEMKFDMCGAASVLGVFRSLGELAPPVNVIGLIPACENMPGGRAVKPGDVVTSMAGQTIEILNTDAEGRLVLCDALTYAERFKPAAVIDIATLTGACMVALGGVRSGLFATDDRLAQALSEAGEAALDPCWRLPLDDDYAEGLKSHFADVANVAGRAGGAITAAKFLQRFATKFPWAHLDIAGTAWKSGAAKGATGRPVGLLLQYLLAGQVAPAGSATRKPRAARKPAAA
jgi:leucyl aminopeptidase